MNDGGNLERSNLSATSDRGVLVWDVPLRLFHWALVVAVTISLLSGQFGNMDTHVISGHVVLALLVFRICWGIVGGRHARFANFVKGPGPIMAYLRGVFGGEPRHYLGHNPLGALSVIALIGVLCVQAGTGLFANDDILTEGPLAKTVSGATSSTLTGIHHLASNVLYVLIGLHLAAIVFYALKGERLVPAMVTGRKKGVLGDDTPGARGNWFVALVVIAVAAAVAYYIFTY